MIKRDDSSGWIFSLSPDYRTKGPTNNMNDITGSVTAPGEEKAIGTNCIKIPAPYPIPSPEETGYRGNGTFYDLNDVWLLNAFRLSETSDPTANSTSMIGFAHSEDHYVTPLHPSLNVHHVHKLIPPQEGTVAENITRPNGQNGCCYNSLLVKYSPDLGEHWTRGLPLLTRGIQHEPEDCEWMEGWSGGTAIAWHSETARWVFLISYDTGLGLVFSNDTLARPGNWYRIDPTTNATEPALKSTREPPHPQLKGVTCASGSIIRDAKNGVYQIILGKWGGGLSYISTKDFVDFTAEVELYDGADGLVDKLNYPTAVGTEGDSLTNDGMATVYFGGTPQQKVPYGRGIYSIDVVF